MTYRNDFLFLSGPALYVHREETTGIFGEIFGGIVPAGDGGNLELELDQLGIEQTQQDVVGAFAIDGG